MGEEGPQIFSMAVNSRVSCHELDEGVSYQKVI